MKIGIFDTGTGGELVANQPILSCDIIVIACNTATTNAIGSLQQRYPDVRFIGFEPMIKSAVILTKSHHITMLATNATKHSQRLRALISEYATGVRIDTPDTRAWAQMID